MTYAWPASPVQGQDSGLDEATQAMRTAGEKAKELVMLSAEMIKTKDFKKIPQLYKLLDEVEQMADSWHTRTITSKLEDRYAQNIAYTTFGNIAKDTAIMRLTIGDVHKNAGEFDKAKKMYRSVINNYTGSNYKSQVKEAEFALEDLKDFEEKWNKQKKSGKPTQRKKP